MDYIKTLYRKLYIHKYIYMYIVHLGVIICLIATFKKDGDW